MSDDVMGNVKEAFSGRRGKILIIGGGAAIAAYVIYTRRNGTPEIITDDELTPVPGVGRVPQTDPPVGNTQTGSTTRRPETNADWLTQGVDLLVGRGTPGANAHDALTKALGGLALTTQQIAWVSQVISVLGSAPEGMPPLNATAPPGGGGTTPPPASGLGAPSGLKQIGASRGSITIAWNPAAGASSYIVTKGPAPYVKYNVGARTNMEWKGLRPGTTHTFSVYAYDTAGKSTKSPNVITARTSK